MKLEGRVPTAQEAIAYFRDMAAGRLPKSGRGRRNKPFTGSWYTSGSRSHPPAKLVTPVAMDIAQAKSRLRLMGQKTTAPKPKSKPRGSVRKPTVKGRGGPKQKRKSRKGQSRDNFA
jgi:hypothetical protein